jgi:glycine oxidase
MGKSKMRALVIGSGIIGSAIAWRLAHVGLKIRVYDRGHLGEESSWAAAGMLAPQAEADGPGVLVNLCLAGLDALHAVYRRLLDESNVNPEYDRAGMLYVALDGEERAELEARLKWQREAGLKLEELTGAQARELVPALSSEVIYALRFADEGMVDNRKLTEAYIQAALRAGVEFYACSAVEEIVVRGNRVVGIRLSDGKVEEADVVVNAAGCWASQIKGCCADGISIYPVRGQILCFEGPPNALKYAVLSPRGYIVPRRNGRLLAGTTREEAGYDKSVTLEGVARIAHGAHSLMPTLGSLPLRQVWAGLRPAAPDHMPVIGPSPTLAGLYYATGHYRNGILLSALTAEIIADLIVGKTPALDLTPVSPARFSADGANR